jgi:hypothetical protein
MDRLFFSIGCALGFTGMALLVGWLCLLWAPWRQRPDQEVAD